MSIYGVKPTMAERIQTSYVKNGAKVATAIEEYADKKSKMVLQRWIYGKRQEPLQLVGRQKTHQMQFLVSIKNYKKKL